LCLSSDETLTRHFNGDVLNVATKCWGQINEALFPALEGKFSLVLDEFKIKEHLVKLDGLMDTNDQPAW